MRIALRFVAALLLIALVTFLALSVGANATTIGFTYLILILGISSLAGLAVGLVSSLVATACFNYFFLPPLHTWVISDPANWVALISFFVAAVVASRLVVRRQERERLEALRESDALKTALLRAVSHDLSTPLTAISLQVERLQKKLDPSTVDELAEQTERLKRRIENLLAMARLEAGTSVPHPEPTPPADLFRAVREHLPLVPNLKVAVSDGCPDVFADPSLALEVLVNLVENAHRAAPRDSVIELVAHPSSRTRVRIEVLDRGPGFTETEGTGLGLVIARSFAAANGGAVTLEKRPGGGAMALLELPAAKLPMVIAEP